MTDDPARGQTFAMILFKGVFFDFDGVIGKTMEDNFRAWKDALARFDMPLGKEEYFLLEGINAGELAGRFLKLHGKKRPDPAELVRLKEEYYLQNNKFALYDGAVKTIDALKTEGFLLALVSAANSARLAKTLPREIMRKFDAVVTGDKISRGKPFPDPYLKAARELSLKPGECLVVENAPMGIESAKNAGMYCVAIDSTLDRKHLRKADRLIADISEVPSLIDMLQGRLR